ncbi:MAG: phosphoadenylyl-sulfate reductase [Solirubrobacterales bacterium]|nr:phosphoadenylyl-sulfate reductase [Solirubrobacterales bacterium]
MKPPATLTGSVPTTGLDSPPFDPEQVAAELESASTEDALRWAIETFGQKLYIACSFQKTSSITVHMASQIDPEARFFYIDTDVLFPETYETKERLEQRYGTKFHRYSSMTLEQQAGLYGDELWGRDPDACCGIRKVDPMRSALASVDCWVSGIRREDSQSRASAPKFAWDKRFNLWKLNPLADWSEQDVWRYISDNDIPYNSLHDEGYPSIGCTHCTRRPAAGEDARAGRWAGTTKTECGLHG